MQVTTMADFQQHMDEYINAVAQNAEEEIVINTPDGKQVMLVSTEGKEDWDETAYLLASPANAARLRAGIAEAERHFAAIRTLEEEQALK